MTTGADRLFRIVTYKGRNDNQPFPMALQLAEVYALLEHEVVDCVMPDGSPGCRGKRPSKEEQCPQKDGAAWAPGYIPQGKTRLNKHVESLDLAVFDVDDFTQAALESLCERLEGVEVYLHSTHTHLSKPGPANQNVRLVLPLSRSINPAEWKALWPAIQKEFGFEADKGTKDPSRLSFLPRAPRGRPYLNVHQAGELLDPQRFLVNAMLAARVANRAAVENAAKPEPGAFDRDELRRCLQRYDPADDFDGEKKALIQRVLDEEPFEEQGRRGKTVTVLAGIVGKLMPHGTPVELALEMLRPSLAAAVLETDDPKTDSIEAWSERIQFYFEQAQTEKQEALAAEQSASGKLARLMLARTNRIAAPVLSAAVALMPPPVPPAPPPDRASSAVLAAAAAAPEDEEDWRLKLLFSMNARGVPVLENIPVNIETVLQNHEEWKGQLRYNLISNEIEVSGGPLTPKQREPELLVTGVRNWFARNENLKMSWEEFDRQIDYVARHQDYDPLRTYLLGLRWDGVPRIGDWLIRYCGARLTDAKGLNVEAYVRTVGQKWLMSGAARGLYTGCKADNVLVLEGEQYVGKSMALSILGGEWFVDTKLNIQDRSTLELTAKSWVVEMAELASMKKSETEAQKAFFSTRIDNIRLAYARRVRPYARRCIFAGTTNETQYLLDITGNRRFWCVWCERIDIEALRRDRDQIWAEAVALVLAGEECANCFGIEHRCEVHRHWLDDATTKLTEVVATSRLKTEYADDIRAWWAQKDPAHRPDYLTISQVVTEILELKIDQKERLMQAIGRALKALGFERHQLRTSEGHRPWVYYPSQYMKTLPREGGGISPRLKLLTNIAQAEVRT